MPYKDPKEARACQRRYRIANLEKVRQQAREHYHRKPEGRKRYAKRWYAANKERVRLKSKQYRTSNKKKRKEALRKWRKANPEKCKAQNRRYRHALLPTPTRSEPTHCECCGKPRGRIALALDHCHMTNTFRGWLCGKCNTGIGKLGDSIAGLQRAIGYLERCHLLMR